MKNKRIKSKKSKDLTRAEKVTLLNETFDSPPPGITTVIEKEISESNLDPCVMNIEISYWDYCPIKSHLDGRYNLISVPFESKCPKTLRCIVSPMLESNSRALSSRDDIPDGWSEEDVKAHNKSAARAVKPKSIAVPVPFVKVGTVCGACTLGNTTSLDSEQEKRSGTRPTVFKQKLPRRKK